MNFLCLLLHQRWSKKIDLGPKRASLFTQMKITGHSGCRRLISCLNGLGLIKADLIVEVGLLNTHNVASQKHLLWPIVPDMLDLQVTPLGQDMQIQKDVTRKAEKYFRKVYMKLHEKQLYNRK